MYDMCDMYVRACTLDGVLKYFKSNLGQHLKKLSGLANCETFENVAIKQTVTFLICSYSVRMTLTS